MCIGVGEGVQLRRLTTTILFSDFQYIEEPSQVEVSLEKETKKMKKSNSKTYSRSLKNITDNVNKFVQSSLAVLRAPKDDCNVFGQYVTVRLRQISSLKTRQQLKRSIERLMKEEKYIKEPSQVEVS